LSGRGNSTVCRAKSPVVSMVLEPKMNLPDTNPPKCRRIYVLNFAADKDFILSLTHSVPIFLD
jgi:hypothetical protein